MWNIVVTFSVYIIYSRGYSLSDLDIVSREEWNAVPPKLVEPMPNPVPYVIIHQCFLPEYCYLAERCIVVMQSMQKIHQDDKGWNDIGYSFAVGGDDRAYTGRGWSAVGAHTLHYNNRSIGICVMGDLREKLPPNSQLNVVKELIDYGVQTGKIQPDYILIGHRQVRDSESPGDALFDEIKTWPHWTAEPPNDGDNVDNVNSGASTILL